MRIEPDGTFEIERDDVAIPCPKCGGYAPQVECTRAERDEFGCGRTYDCCSRAFVCSKCGHRVAMSAPAPEMG